MKKIFLVLILWFLSFTSSTYLEARDYRSSDDDVAVDEDGDWIIDHYRSHPDWVTSNNYECVDSGKNCSYADPAPTSSYGVPINFEYEPSDLCSILYPWTYTRLTDNKCLCPGDTSNSTWNNKTRSCWSNINDLNKKCSTKFPWTIYRSKDDTCICPNDSWVSTWNSETKSCFIDVSRLNQQCSTKFPWTIYRSKDDTCICPNDSWASTWNSETKSCFTDFSRLNQQCNSKFPWTIYRFSDDSCICFGDNLISTWNSDTKSCWYPEVINDSCLYSDGSLAKIGEVSSQYSECTDGGIWKCIQGLEWSQENWSCLAPVSIFCKQKYWVHAIWKIQLNKDGSYMCWCEFGYLLKNKQCVVK